MGNSSGTPGWFCQKVAGRFIPFCFLYGVRIFSLLNCGILRLLENENAFNQFAIHGLHHGASSSSPEDFPENERHDYDQDGLTESEGDCDDLDPDVEGPSSWYADTDGDGFGDPNSSVESLL